MSRHQILISTGSNIEREKHTRQAFNDLHNLFDGMQTSSVYESQSVGFHGTNFFNAVVLAYTSHSLEHVCEVLKQIETENGRIKQAEKFSSRTLDLDLLTYDDVICDFPIVLPREEITYNAFVLQPLAELVPEKIHPIEQKTYSQLWNEYDKSKQKLWVSSFTWSPETV